MTGTGEADIANGLDDSRASKGALHSALRSKKSSSERGNHSKSQNQVNFAAGPVEEKKTEFDVSDSEQSQEGKPRRRSYKTKRRKEAAEAAKAAKAAALAEAKAKEESAAKAKRFSLSNLGKKITCRFGDGKKKQVEVEKEVDFEDDEAPQMEMDPVVQIFESRNTQRVRWALGGLEGNASTEEESTSEQFDAPQTQESKATAALNIKQFMSRALFGSKSSKNLDDEMQAEVASLGGSLVWESATTPTGPEVIHTSKQSNSSASEIHVSFTEDPKARLTVTKLLDKAHRAEHKYFRYEFSVKCYLKALDILKKANYPDDHPTVVRTVDLMNNAHHVLSSYNNSANIVKMGIKYEDAGELVRALKMYTIAYRIRRDNLSRNHPSLVVLLNMLGSIQIKRGELQEAMQIYELALKDSPVIFDANDDDAANEPPTDNLLAKSVTYREMGVIYEQWGRIDEALNIYHKSLECVAEWKETVQGGQHSDSFGLLGQSRSEDTRDGQIHLAPAVSDQRGVEEGEMELVLGSKRNSGLGVGTSSENPYETFFPAYLEKELDNQKPSTEPSTDMSRRQETHADMDLALTLHQIAQLRKSQGEYSKALEAYEVSLRGMKYALGRHHPNVAAVLGNIGNLQKEMGDMDAAYTTYQEVLGIESYRLGLRHPDVAITLHNIATIDAARGNYQHSLQLYRKVISLQKKLFGEEHLSVAVATACMGDVYEKIGELHSAMEKYEESVRIKSAALGRHSLDVARLLHKLGKLAFLSGDFLMADSFLSRAVLIYRLNKVDEEHEWMVDANRDTADIDAALAMGRGQHFEC
eukprot:Nitzschia sp. Nitz4//scaffold11_size288233//59465//61900//NITZ4_000745-RA/size288233-processed-gene-0.209-mRNA-1//-1//CDS//3329533987//389//frame0